MSASNNTNLPQKPDPFGQVKALHDVTHCDGCNLKFGSDDVRHSSPEPPFKTFCDSCWYYYYNP